MEEGYLNPGIGAVFWGKERGYTPSSAERIAGGMISLGKSGFRAYRCTYCRIVFFPYGVENEETKTGEQEKLT